MTHRDALVICRACGKRVPRKGRFQAYCSRRCRQRAYWDRQKWPPTDFGKAPLNLLGGGLWRWSETPPLAPLIRSRIIAAEIGESEVKGAPFRRRDSNLDVLRAPNGCEPTAFVFRRDAKFT
jgi:hypothetical protein